MTELVQQLLVDDADEELGWQERALCAQTDPESFFPEKGGSTREAKKVCLACEVRSECLEYALANDERFGIWGGLSERKRRRLKKAAICPGGRRPPTTETDSNGPSQVGLSTGGGPPWPTRRPATAPHRGASRRPFWFCR